MGIKKRQQSANLMRAHEDIFRCPICSSNISVVESASLVCGQLHTFDIARQGYVYLLRRPSQEKYDKSMFAARRHVMRNMGFFNPVLKKMVDCIVEYLPRMTNQISVLDAGCGEGTHLASVCSLLGESSLASVTGVGIDIVKDGVVLAARDYAEQIWCVADVAQVPFQNGSFDVILNILSPSNYQEFARILKDDGILVKVVPQSGYLQELRSALFAEPKRQGYSNTDVVSHFKEQFDLLNQEELRYEIILDGESLRDLVAMTPLSWSADKEKIDSFIGQGSQAITVHLDLLVGKK